MNCVLIILRGYFFRYEKVKTKSCFRAIYFSSMFSITLYYQKYDLRSNPSHLWSFWTWVRSRFWGFSVHVSLHILFSPSQTNQTERTNSWAITEITLDKPTQELWHKHKVQVTNTIRRQSIQLGTNKSKSQHRHSTDGWREPCNLEWKHGWHRCSLWKFNHLTAISVQMPFDCVVTAQQVYQPTLHHCPAFTCTAHCPLRASPLRTIRAAESQSWFLSPSETQSRGARISLTTNSSSSSSFSLKQLTDQFYTQDVKLITTTD